ncbi:hypothetical protein ACIPSE_19045 [Streptomyces sp. NPDC090106]|uniref:hypothetical protein n=1 Tax=Streptomyces sp. NPDC090106 TaxID=3365946 RepID=UPI0037FB8A1A
MVRRLLGEPDLLLRNPHFPSAPQSRLYRLERIEEAERTEEFRAVAAAAARRSAAARAVALRRRREVLARIATEPIDVPRLSPEQLTALAVDHHTRLDGERARRRDEPAAAGGVEPARLARWKVDYLCHRLTRHGELLAGLQGATGRAAAEELLTRRICAAVSEAYPELAAECERRLRERGKGARS